MQLPTPTPFNTFSRISSRSSHHFRCLSPPRHLRCRLLLYIFRHRSHHSPPENLKQLQPTANRSTHLLSGLRAVTLGDWLTATQLRCRRPPPAAGLSQLLASNLVRCQLLRSLTQRRKVKRFLLVPARPTHSKTNYLLHSRVLCGRATRSRAATHVAFPARSPSALTPDRTAPETVLSARSSIQISAWKRTSTERTPSTKRTTTSTECTPPHRVADGAAAFYRLRTRTAHACGPARSCCHR
mmetsp:Transcript_18395/g.46769  ORF Transcript_18395/g.46769 Transcript_18395/m.46769 type:complete len:241 (-) Transcript_18395:447-1169(-)